MSGPARSLPPRRAARTARPAAAARSETARGSTPLAATPTPAPDSAAASPPAKRATSGRATGKRKHEPRKATDQSTRRSARRASKSPGKSPPADAADRPLDGGSKRRSKSGRKSRRRTAGGPSGRSVHRTVERLDATPGATPPDARPAGEPSVDASGESSGDAGDARRRDRRRAIVETAARLFAQFGYDDCDMERVAADLNVAKGTLYLYFPGKQELFYACLDGGLARMQEAVFAAAAPTKPALDRIGDAIGAYLQFFDEHPETVELMIQERALFRGKEAGRDVGKDGEKSGGKSGKGKGTYFEYRDQIRPFFRPIYAELVRDGILRDDLPVDRMLDTIGAMLYGTMFFNHAAGRSTPLETQRAGLIDAVFRGLLSDAARRRLAT